MRLASLVHQHEQARVTPVARAGHQPDPGPPDVAEDTVTQPILVPGGPGSRPPAEPRHLAVRRSESGRLAVNAHQVAVAALLVLGLVVAVAWWTLRAVPHSDNVPMANERYFPSTTAAGPDPVQMPSTESSQAAGRPTDVSATGVTRLVIDVAGKVRSPGIVELPPGSRVVDAIAAAGGARRGVSLTSLNLARPLVDGEQIVVGLEVASSGGDLSAGGVSSTTGVTTVDINTATAEQLDTLPGVGPVTAAAILRWRADNGPFTSVDELLDVSGIGSATLADIRPYVYV